MPRRKIVRSVPQTSSVIDMKTGMPVSPPSIPVICERIRYFRELAGIEQKELGKKIGISPNTISNYRVKMKKGAIGDRDTFEQRVQQIGKNITN